MAGPIYQTDPRSLPDAAFVEADLEHAAVGNRGRWLDPRRTPLRIAAVDVELCEIEVEIAAFEDRGARWRLPAWEISRLQLARGGARAEPRIVAGLRAGVDRFDQPLTIEADLSALRDTARCIAERRAGIRPMIERVRGLLALEAYVDRLEGEPQLYAALDEQLAREGLLDMERRLTETLASNPGSGELVKGHAIALARLGLCSFTGSAIRDPTLFAGEWSLPRRTGHILLRIAFVQELWACHFGATARLYRAAATAGALTRRAPSLVSCTFAERVADAHREGAGAATSVKWQQDVDPTCLLMTFLETRAFNAPYREAEALVIGDPDDLSPGSADPARIGIDGG